VKLDKETTILIAICVILLFAWDPICNKIWPPKPKKQIEEAATKTNVNSSENKKIIENKNTVSKQTKIENSKKDITTPLENNSKKVETTSPFKKDAPALPKEQTQLASTSNTPTFKAPIVNKTGKTFPNTQLENDLVTIQITPISGKITKIILKKYFKSDKKTHTITDQNVIFFNNTTDGALGIADDSPWSVNSVKLEKNNSSSELTLIREISTQDGQNFILTQNWNLQKNYTVLYNISFKNLSSTKLVLDNIKIGDGGVPNIHEFADDKVPFRESHEISYYDPEAEKVFSKEAAVKAGMFSTMFGGGKISENEKSFKEIFKAHASWVAVSNKYFTCLLAPEKFNFNAILMKSIIKPKEVVEGGVKDFVIAEVDGILNINIDPQQTYNASFKYFAGPKKIEYLQSIHPRATEIMRLYMLGMKFLEPLSRLMLSALLWLNGLCGSYGLSIILLTLIVKTMLWPFTHKANVSMRKMQKINPIIQELRKKYKKDHQRLNIEMMKLYKEHKVNPFGGCLPIILQMPIFFALYSALSGAVEPRHTAFLWIHDLTLPDTVATIAGLPINPLMLLMTGSMILQQKLTPSAADPAQQRMMMFMPLIMLVMLYSLPSGLTLYWTVSQLISIAQLVVNKKLEQRAENTAALPLP
jgi:YidC/Oxa1 family membrane protein insertase